MEDLDEREQGKQRNFQRATLKSLLRATGELIERLRVSGNNSGKNFVEALLITGEQHYNTHITALPRWMMGYEAESWGGNENPWQKVNTGRFKRSSPHLFINIWLGTYHRIFLLTAIRKSHFKHSVTILKPSPGRVLIHKKWWRRDGLRPQISCCRVKMRNMKKLNRWTNLEEIWWWDGKRIRMMDDNI